jgi:hypothetical protein
MENSENTFESKTQRAWEQYVKRHGQPVVSVSSENMALVVVALLFKIAIAPFRLIWFLLYEFPKSLASALTVGVVRLGLVAWFSYGSSLREVKEFFSETAGMSENITLITCILLGLSCMYWGLTGIMHILGRYDGQDAGYTYSPSTGYANINEALEFRDGLMGQKTSRGKMEEMAKTGFVTRQTFREATSRSENEREALEFLDGRLGQLSTRGKYEELKRLFGRGK